MADDPAKLRTTLTDLHAKLASYKATDPEMRALLEAAVADIQNVLDNPPNAEEYGDATVVGRLKRAAQHYEERHPTLSGILGSIVDTLSRMGI